MIAALQSPRYNHNTGLLDVGDWYVASDKETTVTDYLGADWVIPAGHIAVDGARVVDLGGGAFEFYNRDADGILIDPNPTLRYDPAAGPILHPSAGAIDPNEGSLFMELTLPVDTDALPYGPFAYAALGDEIGVDNLLLGYARELHAHLLQSSGKDAETSLRHGNMPAGTVITIGAIWSKSANSFQIGIVVNNGMQQLVPVSIIRVPAEQRVIKVPYSYRGKAA